MFLLVRMKLKLQPLLDKLGPGYLRFEPIA
jgi:hypothetical protein